MKRSAASSAFLLMLVAGPAAFGQADEIRRLQDIAGSAFDQAAAANATAALLQAKVDEQSARISTLESQLAELNRAADEAAKAKVWRSRGVAYANAHKDRFASQISVGLSVHVREGSTLVLYDGKSDLMTVTSAAPGSWSR